MLSYRITSPSFKMNRGMTQRTRIRYTRLPARERLWWQSISPFFLIKKTDSKFHISTAIKFQDVTDNCTLNTRDLLLINCVSVTSMGRNFHPKAWTTTWPQNFYQRPGISFFFFFDISQVLVWPHFFCPYDSLLLDPLHLLKDGNMRN